MSQKSIHSTAPVPLTERRGPLTMGLLWITMVTGFASLLTGFEWHKQGLTFTQALFGTVLSCLILLVYSIPATQLGAQTGLGYITLSRGIFGRWGSRLVTVNLIWICTLFYGLIAVLLADSLNGLFNLNWSLPWFAAGLALIMSINNFFGFQGVANFARYLAAPLLIACIGYSFFKAVSSCPTSVLIETPHQSFSKALTIVSTYVIGYAAWGNEKDYWRFSVPKPIYSVIPLAVALAIGQIIFPITGWMVSKMTGITEFSAAAAYMTNYSFGGIVWLAALVIGTSYCASNDSNLFATIQACETIKDLPHRTWVSIMAIISAVVSFLLSMSGAAKSLEVAASLSCVIMPTPTVIMLAEWFLLIKVFKTKSISMKDVHELKQLPNIRWPALAALLSGFAIGLLTSGAIPGTETFHIGICSLQAWLTALIVYVPCRHIEHKQLMIQKLTALENILAKRFEQASARIPISNID